MTLNEMNILANAKDTGKCTDEYYNAVMNGLDNWVPAGLGFETWTTARNGRVYLYVFNPSTREHGWLDDADIVNPDNPYGLG